MLIMMKFHVFPVQAFFCKSWKFNFMLSNCITSFLIEFPLLMITLFVPVKLNFLSAVEFCIWKLSHVNVMPKWKHLFVQQISTFEYTADGNFHENGASKIVKRSFVDEKVWKEESTQVFFWVFSHQMMVSHRKVDAHTPETTTFIVFVLTNINLSE